MLLTYKATFTPADTDNYKSVTKDITVDVSKAVPVIGTVSANTVSDILDASAVTLSRTDESVKGTLELTDEKLFLDRPHTTGSLHRKIQ